MGAVNGLFRWIVDAEMDMKVFYGLDIILPE